MQFRDSIPLQVTFEGKVLKGYARPMNEKWIIRKLCRTYQIYFFHYYKGTMMYYEDRGWIWQPQKAGALEGIGKELAAIIEAWYG